MDRQRKLAETLRSQADAEARGEDAERAKNWEWTVEENEEWEKKLARKARRADFEFHGTLSSNYSWYIICSYDADDAHAARRKYKKDVDHLKPDLEAYNRQKEIALGLAPGTLDKSGQGSSSSALTTFDPSAGQLVPSETAQQLAAESLYRDANSLLYADNKPSEDAIDRVVGKLNLDADKKRKFSRKRANEDEGDITYINERNRIFNKKVRLLSRLCREGELTVVCVDCEVLRQVYYRDSEQLRAWHCALDVILCILVSCLFSACILGYGHYLPSTIISERIVLVVADWECSSIPFSSSPVESIRTKVCTTLIPFVQ